MLLVFPAHAQVEGADPTPLEGEPCDTEIDEFTDRVSVECPFEDMRTEEHVGEQLYQRRAVLTRSKGVTALHFLFRSESWNFLDADFAYALIDGNNHKWKLERVASDTEGADSVFEDHAVRLNQSQLKALANSETFRVKIKQSVFNLSDTNLSSHAKHLLRVIDQDD